jgi:hypothetical protein
MLQLLVLLSEAELPLAEVHRVEASQAPAQTLSLLSQENRGPSTWFFFASEEEQSLRCNENMKKACLQG